MNYEVVAIPNFRKELKKLAKKYPSIKEEFEALLKSLEVNPLQGVSLGNNCYKIRMAISSKGKGKSGGSRVITFVKISQTTVYLLSIYDKSEKENISDGELKELLNFLKV
ncbi:MAG: type II toxin-antitoxin system RelE/ParE family toxin [Algoriphagus sp.]|nr:type II toxin-antitoxin system RelE/ParE family toxin [Algoriphagus sp.]